MSKGKVTAKTKVKKVKKKPIKAGSLNKGGDGGIFTEKVIKIRAKMLKERNKNG